MDWEILPLGSIGHTRSSIKKVSFSCGESESDKKLNSYLKQYAWKNDEIGLARTFVAVLKEDHKKVIGYYTSSMSVIEFPDLPTEVSAGLPAYPIPAMLIGKLAVDESFQGQRIGTKLVLHAYRSAAKISEVVGVYAIKVDAKNEALKKFYIEKCGFYKLQNKELGLFIPIAEVREAIRIKDNLGMNL